MSGAMNQTNGNGHVNGSDERLAKRLNELQIEFEKGRCKLEALDRQRTETKDTMLRLQGAIQVIQELLEPAPVAVPADAAGEQAPP